MQQDFEFQFEWDPVKARQNRRKHGVTFARAATVFLDRYALSAYDAEHSQSEHRWVTLGLDGTGMLLVVCHTYEEQQTSVGARIRIISARKATRTEVSQYQGR